MLENPRKFKNSLNLLLLFVKITKFLEFFKKLTIKTIVFSNSDQEFELKWTLYKISWKPQMVSSRKSSSSARLLKKQALQVRFFSILFFFNLIQWGPKSTTFFSKILIFGALRGSFWNFQIKAKKGVKSFFFSKKVVKIGFFYYNFEIL